MIVIDDNFKKDIGKRLKQLREQKEYTINYLIEKLNNNYYLDIDEKTIRRYEKGDFLPKIDNLIIFSDLYETTLDFIVFGKETSDDNSFTFKDNFKRLNRLMFSSMLLPWKDTDVESEYYDKYFFTGYDEELKLYMDSVMFFFSEKNYSFEVRGKNPKFDIHDLDNLTKDFDEYKEQLTPSFNRLNNLLVESNIDPQEYLETKIKDIQKKRKTK